MTVQASENRPGTEQRTTALPLIVDLDGTLLRTDTLFECIAENMRTRPIWTLIQMMLLPFSIAKIKARLQGGADIDVTTLPVNEDVAGYCREAKAAGRTVWLVSAADHDTVQRIADQFGFFDRAIGSDGVVNNKGGNKAKLLQQAFPDGFEYVGDSPADMKVWKAAKAASIVGGGERRKAAVEREGVTVARTFERKEFSLKAWRKAMRMHQWAKNSLIFVAPVLALEIMNPDALIRCLIAFPLIGMVASGTYFINDLLDLKADRVHHSKYKRPFASGAIKLWQGFVAAPLLIVGGIAGGALLSPPFALTMIMYLVITLSYSLALKRMPLLDTMVLGFLYTLRLIMGGVLVSVPVTQWLVVFSMFLFVSLSLAKRHVEVARKAAAGERKIANRGYKAEDAPLTLGLGLATATASPVILVLYLMDSAWPSGMYMSPSALWAAPVVLSLWLMRVWMLANRVELDDDPVTFAVKDKYSIALGGVLGLAFLLAVVGSPVSLSWLGLQTPPQVLPAQVLPAVVP